ncbi:MAG: MFS transporter [Alcaligenaceae bacterium]|nr:MFS transporter [Alcaligenaceae bacterium]
MTTQTAERKQKVIGTTDANQFVTRIVAAIAVAHLLNDLIQAVLPAIFPMLKLQFDLSFAQVGLIALIYQLTASLLQPWIGFYTDKHPKPFLLPVGMACTMTGLGILAMAPSFFVVLVGAAVIGIGSATFHPEASRVARLASGGRFGTAQSAFQVGGNTGSALGPLLAAALIIPYGQSAIAWLMLIALTAITVLYRISRWSQENAQNRLKGLSSRSGQGLSRCKLIQAIVVICSLMFAKFVYIGSFTNYFTFYLIQRFELSIQQSQIFLFVFLASVAIGTFAGGPIGDRLGRNRVIWISFIGAAPFALALPHSNLVFTAIFASMIGLIMSSAFAAMVVYAQEAAPGRVGLISGLMFGLMFGIGGLGAAGLGLLADQKGVIWVYQLTSFLPLLGLATILLPSTRNRELAE